MNPRCGDERVVIWWKKWYEWIEDDVWNNFGEASEMRKWMEGGEMEVRTQTCLAPDQWATGCLG